MCLRKLRREWWMPPSLKNETVFVWDSELKGFGLKVTPKGRKSLHRSISSSGRLNEALHDRSSWLPLDTGHCAQ